MLYNSNTQFLLNTVKCIKHYVTDGGATLEVCVCVGGGGGG